MRNEDRKVCTPSAQLLMAYIDVDGQYIHITINKNNLYELGIRLIGRTTQGLSTCGTWKAHRWYAKESSLYKKLESIIIHIIYYLVDLIKLNNKNNI